MASHTVVQGEYVAKIALDYGFTDFMQVWTYGPNAELRGERKSPNVLLPGDTIEIPEKNTAPTSGATDQRHRFKVKGKPPRLRIVLLNADETPISSTACKLTVGTEAFELTTDDAGLIEQEIKHGAEDAELEVDGLVIPLKVGHLDPVSAPSGQRSRLENLGYPIGDDAEPQAFRSAVEEFQCDHGLTVDGECGPQTQAKLEEVHGS